jgi:hypothetical protein
MREAIQANTAGFMMYYKAWIAAPSSTARNDGEKECDLFPIARNDFPTASLRRLAIILPNHVIATSCNHAPPNRVIATASAALREAIQKKQRGLML